MHIQRIQVPDFRALKNVDITFEKEFTPRIFPLGSQNGGGKSTLLQLIFVLLHCAGNPERVEFIQNLLHGFDVNDESGKRTLAIIDICDGSKTVKLDFFIWDESYILKLLEEDNGQHHIKELKLYDLSDILPNIQNNIVSIENRISEINEFIERINKPLSNTPSLPDSFEILENQIQAAIGQLAILEVTLENEKSKKNIIETRNRMFIESLHKRDLLYIYSCELISIDNKLIQKTLICKIDGTDIDEPNKFLTYLSNKIFLTAHVSQIFLFLQPDKRKSLFKKQENNQTNYYQQIKTANSKLPGFFTYDFLAIDILIEAFKKARDDDFKQAVEQGGNYGNNYVKLLDELNNLLSNKKINVEPDLSGINFKIDGDETELYPEDLSHGELKRLCIYMWLKHNRIEDAIVLMDELEISFHPDWQYQIVRDLEEWGATNQYILATHSYELCNAVTPAHVKELEPKLPAKTIQ